METKTELKGKWTGDLNISDGKRHDNKLSLITLITTVLRFCIVVAVSTAGILELQYSYHGADTLAQFKKGYVQIMTKSGKLQ